jgi:hypothetical protein
MGNGDFIQISGHDSDRLRGMIEALGQSDTSHYTNSRWTSALRAVGVMTPLLFMSFDDSTHIK